MIVVVWRRVKIIISIFVRLSAVTAAAFGKNGDQRVVCRGDARIFLSENDFVSPRLRQIQ